MPYPRVIRHSDAAGVVDAVGEGVARDRVGRRGEAKEQAAADLTAAARDGALSITIGGTFPLERVAEAYDLVDAGTRHRVVVALS
jgi:NADPH:quinone reductase-like Zn-dependent oxidoreductase